MLDPMFNCVALPFTSLPHCNCTLPAVAQVKMADTNQWWGELMAMTDGDDMNDPARVEDDEISLSGAAVSVATTRLLMPDRWWPTMDPVPVGMTRPIDPPVVRAAVWWMALISILYDRPASQLKNAPVTLARTLEEEEKMDDSRLKMGGAKNSSDWENGRSVPILHTPVVELRPMNPEGISLSAAAQSADEPFMT